eukprot:1161346-Pelagomonas_calceolata.AAC.1
MTHTYTYTHTHALGLFPWPNHDACQFSLAPGRVKDIYTHMRTRFSLSLTMTRASLAPERMKCDKFGPRIVVRADTPRLTCSACASVHNGMNGVHFLFWPRPVVRAVTPRLTCSACASVHKGMNGVYLELEKASYQIELRCWGRKAGVAGVL